MKVTVQEIEGFFVVGFFVFGRFSDWWSTCLPDEDDIEFIHLSPLPSKGTKTRNKNKNNTCYLEVYSQCRDNQLKEEELEWEPHTYTCKNMK